jgi:hypothetical protein
MLYNVEHILRKGDSLLYPRKTGCTIFWWCSVLHLCIVKAKPISESNVLIQYPKPYRYPNPVSETMSWPVKRPRQNQDPSFEN